MNFRVYFDFLNWPNILGDLLQIIIW